jgi:pilus assembly protein CpaF
VKVTEVVGMEGEVITMQDLFEFDYSAGRDAEGRVLGSLRSTGLRPKFTQTLKDAGVELPMSAFALGDLRETA